MKKVFIISFLAIALAFTACEKKMTIQRYFVEHTDQEGFMTVSIPSSVLQLKDTSDVKMRETLKNFGKLNILVYRDSEESGTTRQEESAIISSCFENQEFKDLMVISSGEANIDLKFLGDSENVKEIVGFVDHPSALVLVRVVGKNLQTKEVAQIMNKVDFNSSDLSRFANFMPELK